MKKNKPTTTAINPNGGKKQNSISGIGTIKPKSTPSSKPKEGKENG